MSHTPAVLRRFGICLFAFCCLVFAPCDGFCQTLYLGTDAGPVTPAVANSSFTSALALFGVDDLESYPGFSLDPTLTFPGTGATAQSDVNFVAAFAALAVSGTNSLLDAGPASATEPGIPDWFALNKPVTGFGFYATNVGDSDANTLSLILENTVTASSKTVPVGTFGPGLAFNNRLFIGVTDTDPFNKITLVESNDFDGVLLDNITVGFIPEPSSWMLAGLVIAGCGIWWRQGR
ncbi:MAG: PEP-CTERM sorting domain-containing protein [Pirellulales bacterium]|nr:PEP-CTERM sorting domain-containing protein [Pirellulales bacterium]